MAQRSGDKPRERGHIRQRGNSFQACVYAGVDPHTRKRLYLTDSTTDEKEAERIRTRLISEVDEERHARTKGSLRVAMEDWLRLTELGDETRDTYKMYARRFSILRLVPSRWPGLKRAP
ncbi:hypothetical protein [Amycolatopsis sp. NPDC054798]